MLEHRFDLWQRACASERVGGGQIPKTELKGFRVFFRGIKWLALAAENVCVQEFIPEFAMRIVFLAQLNKAGQPPINRFQLRRRHAKKLSPVRPGLKWS